MGARRKEPEWSADADAHAHPPGVLFWGSEWLLRRQLDWASMGGECLHKKAMCIPRGRGQTLINPAAGKVEMASQFPWPSPRPLHVPAPFISSRLVSFVRSGHRCRAGMLRCRPTRLNPKSCEGTKEWRQKQFESKDADACSSNVVWRLQPHPAQTARFFILAR